MTTTLRIHGLDCADEASELREALQSRAGVRESSFDLLRGLMIVDHDEAAITRDDLIAAVAKIGLRAEPLNDESPAEAEDSETHRVVTATAFRVLRTATLAASPHRRRFKTRRQLLSLGEFPRPAKWSTKSFR